MPEHRSPLAPPPTGWQDAFAALPLESPPADGWSKLAARLDARRQRRWPLWAASAAVLAVAAALPWRLAPPTSTAPGPDVPAAVAAQAPGDPLQQLQAESAQYEALLGFARDERVSSASAAVLADAFDAQLVAIDAALRRPGLARDTQLALWQQRVDSLRAAAGFESNRRWLAAQGSLYDASLVALD